MPILIANYGFYWGIRLIKLHEWYSKRIPDRSIISSIKSTNFLLIYVFGDMKLFYQFCQSKQKQFQVRNLYKTRKYTKNGPINLKYESVLYNFSCTCLKIFDQPDENFASATQQSTNSKWWWHNSFVSRPLCQASRNIWKIS